MSQYQCDIQVSRGRIASVNSFNGGVRIHTERGIREYPGCFVLPGFVDAHAHIVGLGMRLNGLSLYECQSAEQCVQHAALCGANRADWITGMGWNQELWLDTRMPYRQQIDEIISSNPVYLRRADGHAAWVNTRALHIAGINDHTENPSGGEIVRDADGRATGILVDNAMELVARLLPPFTSDQIEVFIKQALRACSAKGLTEIHDMDVSPAYVPIFREMAERGELLARVQTWVSAQNDEWSASGILPAVGEFQRTVGVKFYADGALGSRGAALMRPYVDAPSTTGLLLISDDDLFRKSALAIEAGFHVATHAIGDDANRRVLNVYGRLRADGVADTSTILRVEHAQIVDPHDRALFSKHDVWASVQPVHCTSDAPMAEKRLGERCSIAYPWRSLRNAGARICAGSDFPIESYDPLLGIDAFCRRVPFASHTPWYSTECLTRAEALSAYTEWAHDSVDAGYRRGKLNEGFDADFVVWDRDLSACPDEDVLSARVVATYCGGVLHYES